jgi:hypothetical protein
METTVMKTNRLNSILSSAILSSAIVVGLFASTGSAQAQNGQQLKVTIPFAFQAGSNHMPAGVYQITLQDHVMLLQDRDPGKYAAGFLMVTPSEDGTIQTKGRLVFHRYGDKYFLREIWEANSKHGITCSSSSEEKEIRLAQNHQAVPQTQVAVNVEPEH